MIDLDNILRPFRAKGNRADGFLFYNSVTGKGVDGFVGPELLGHHNHALTDTAAGWVFAATAVTVGTPITTGTQHLSALVSGTIYPLDASGGAITLAMDAVPTDGTVLDFVIVDNTGAITIQVNHGGGLGDLSYWGRDIIIPAGTAKGAHFRLVAVTNGTSVKWASAEWEEQTALPAAAITASCNMSTLVDGALYPVTSAGGAVVITLDNGGVNGKRVRFIITNDTADITIAPGAFGYWGATNIVFPATESAGKYIELWSNGTKWSINDSPDVVTPGNVRVLADNKAVSVGAGNDFSVSHDGTDTTATSATGDFILDNTNITGSTILRLGTDTADTDFQVQNNSAVAALTIFGTGVARFGFNVDANAGLDVAGGNITLENNRSLQGLGNLNVNTAAPAAGSGTAGYTLGAAAGAGAAASGAGVAAANGGALTLAGGAGGAGLLADAAGAGSTATLSGGRGGAGTAAVIAGLGGNTLVYGGAAGADGGFGGNNGGDVIVRGGVPSGAGVAGGFMFQSWGGAVRFGITDAGQGDFGGNLDVTGGVDIDADNAALTIGASADLSIAHDGTDTTVTSITGDLKVDNTNPGGKTSFICGDDAGASGLYFYNNSLAEQFSLLSSGQASFTGNVDAKSGLDITGANLTLGAGAMIKGSVNLTLDFTAAAALGAGCTFDIQGGTGGIGTGGAAGAGGATSFKGGTGGAANTHNGGNGGNVTIEAGTGGAGVATKTAGQGATLYLYGGQGGALGGGAGNAGGDVVIRGGLATAGANGTVAVQLRDDAGATAFQVKNNTGTVVCAIDSYGRKQAQVLLSNSMFPGMLAPNEFSPNAACGSMQLAQGLNDKLLLIFLPGLKIGDQITEVRVLGGAVSAGNAWTIHGDGAAETGLLKTTKNAGLPTVTGIKWLAADATGNASAALDVALTPAAAETVVADTEYYVLVKVSTGAGVTVDIIGAEATVNRL